MKKTFHLLILLLLIMFTNIMMVQNTTNFSLMMTFNLASLTEFITSISILVDWISISFMIMVMMISTLVLNYSVEYMNEEKLFNKFILIMMVFILSMILMLFSSSLFWMMIGWDGLGLSSFCLIMFFQNWNSFNSAMTTFLSNRIGDLFLISSIWISMCIGSSACWLMLQAYPMLSFMLMMTSFSKSAQIPFSSWLPLAMAAPTPVSSLVHSSTLITAGVFLMIRFHHFFQTNKLISILSVITLLLASSSALMEYDLKKIIALSTLSHIALMILFISTSNKEVAVTHLIMHACFKSTLFMSAGMIIHNNMSNQDIRKMFIPMSSNPKLWSIFSISLLSMSGFPFLSGFYSKDSMLLSMPENSTLMNSSLLWLTTLSALLTSSYSFRIFMFMMKTSSSSTLTMMEPKKSSKMMDSMIIGSIMSTFMGGLLTWMMFPKETFLDMSIMSMTTKTNLIMSMICGMLIALTYVIMRPSQNYTSPTLNNMWFINSFTMIWQSHTFKMSQLMFSKIDCKGWTDFTTELTKNMIYNKSTSMLNTLFYNHFTKTMVIVMIMILIQLV